VISTLASSDAAIEPPGGNPLVEIDELVVDYVTRDRVVRAVDGVSFSIRAGEIVGLAGESGCGKSTMANAVMQVLRSPAKLTAGDPLQRREPRRQERRAVCGSFRWRNVSMVSRAR